MVMTSLVVSLSSAALSVRATSSVLTVQPRGQAESSAKAVASEAKKNLLNAVRLTKRGARTTAEQRAAVEEAQVAVEVLGGATLADGLDLLDGLWELEYTTAPDVVGLLQAPLAFPLPLLQVGSVYQRFICRGRGDGGTVQNVVRWSIAGLLEESKGITLTVTAGFELSSPRSISLRFEEAEIGDVRISSELESLLAPAVLPRSTFSMEILQSLRALKLTVPLRTPSSLTASSTPSPSSTFSPSSPSSRGARYQLTYLDEDMLVGRALQPAGSFVFQRVQDYK